jgi:hypothetical protein
MKTPLRYIVIAVAVAVSSTAFASVGGLDVTVKKNGKAVYTGKTDTSGSFNTGSLEPGPYNIELRAPRSMNLKGQKLAISVRAGKDAPRQSSADGAHLLAGVAMSVEVAKTARLSGQVTQAGRMVEAKTPEGMEKVKANVKVINGKRHVWVPAPIGSNMGGRWVEEGTEGAVLNTSNKKGGDAEVLQKIVDQAGNVGQR